MSIMTGIIYFLAGWKAIDIIFTTGKEIFIAIKLYKQWKKEQKLDDIKK